MNHLKNPFFLLKVVLLQLGMSPLHYSCMNGHVHTTELLCRSGVSWNGRTKTEKTPLHYAAQYGHRKIVALLIKLGADVNAIDMVIMFLFGFCQIINNVGVCNKFHVKLDLFLCSIVFCYCYSCC